MNHKKNPKPPYSFRIFYGDWIVPIFIYMLDIVAFTYRNGFPFASAAAPNQTVPLNC